MSSPTVLTIKEKLGIAEVLGTYIKLEKSGANFKAKCPFHNEKTPSFFVSTNRDTYYCFGCGVKGDIFNFVEHFEGVDFMGALKILADRAGVPLKLERREVTDERERRLMVLESATSWFEKNLAENNSVLEYLKKRGLKSETIKTWRLGYVGAQWRSLLEAMRANKISDEDLLAVGLIKKSDTAKDHYDTFRGRIIFPIFDASGRVIAFSGRIFEDDGKSPKYINSPDTDLFRKSEVLYGLHLAKTNIRRLDYSILVEGQMDIVMSHQAGFGNTIATSGTALTSEQVERLKKLSLRIIMAFDADQAGFKAANRNAVLALSLGLEVKVATLPTANDPADLIKDNDQVYRQVLTDAKPLIDFYLDHLLKNENNPRNIARAVRQQILPYIAMIESAVDRSQFINNVSRRTGLKEEALWEDLKQTKPAALDQETVSSPQVDEKTRELNVSRMLAGIIFWQESLGQKRLLKKDQLENKIIKIAGKDGLDNLLTEFEGDKDALIFQVEAHFTNQDRLIKELVELLLNFERIFLNRELALVRQLLSDAEMSGASKEQHKWQLRSQELIKQKSDLEQRLRGSA